jgi:hypothetical protein
MARQNDFGIHWLVRWKTQKRGSARHSQRRFHDAGRPPSAFVLVGVLGVALPRRFASDMTITNCAELPAAA